MARGATRKSRPQEFDYAERARQRQLGNGAYGKLWAIVDGGVKDALKSHPDYLTPKGMKSARTSIVKRVTGTVIGFAEQSAKGRGATPAENEERHFVGEPHQAEVASTAAVEAGAPETPASPHCRIGRVRLKPSPAETALRDENIALGAQVFALECVVASLRRRGRERRRDATDIARAIAARAAAYKKRFANLGKSVKERAIQQAKRGRG